MEICRHLEIAPSKLSALLKELTGNSLTQTIDAVRAEGVRRKMRGAVRGFVSEQVKALSASLGTEKGRQTGMSAPPTTAWDLWKALRASRKWPAFSQNTWAWEFGFCSYRKMYRACMVVYEKTPHQMEMELIEECLKELAGWKPAVQVRGKEEVFLDLGLEKVEELVKEIGAFQMLA